MVLPILRSILSNMRNKDAEKLGQGDREDGEESGRRLKWTRRNESYEVNNHLGKMLGLLQFVSGI